MAANSTNIAHDSMNFFTAMGGAWEHKENRYALLIAVACAYLSLFNLGYAPLWSDEPGMASVARNLLDSGKYTAWDGRNLLAADNGRTVNQELVAVTFPPWQVISTLVGIALFGYNETGVRFFHALLGLASLFVFWQLLRLDFASKPRLRVIAFALFALSAQSILFFRQGRYVADAIFFSLAVMYAYRLYIGTGGKPWHLACAAAFAVLNFFNQFFIGITTMLALATWHLMFHWRATTRKQWVSFVIAGTVFSAVCLGYLWAAGIIEDRENLDLGNLEFQHPWLLRGFYLTIIHFRDMVLYNWVPMWIALWLLGWLGWMAIMGLRSSRPARPEDKAMTRYLVFFCLVLVYAAFVIIKSPSIHPLASTRYLAAALPFAFLLIAACVDWVWRNAGALPALTLFAALTLSNLVGQPVLYMKSRLTLPSLIHEIHTPLRNSMVEVTEYLEAFAKPDDLIQVEPWHQRDVLMFYLGDKLRFCCMLDKETTPLPPETVLSMGGHLYLGEDADWVVTFIPYFNGGENTYLLAFASETHRYASYHRPEIEQHFFSFPAEQHKKAYIYKRKSGKSGKSGNRF